MKWLDLVAQLAALSLARAAQQATRWRWRLFQALVCLLLAAICGLAVLLLAAALALLLYWESHRHEVLAGLLLLYAALGAWFMRRAARWAGVARFSEPGACANSEP
jgi:predicted membrane-bound spermidine synthase